MCKENKITRNRHKIFMSCDDQSLFSSLSLLSVESNKSESVAAFVKKLIKIPDDIYGAIVFATIRRPRTFYYKETILY